MLYEEVLLRNLASIYFQQEENIDSGDSKLYCFMLRISGLLSSFEAAHIWAAFFAL
jgi:hypothetical protein